MTCLKCMSGTILKDGLCQTVDLECSSAMNLFKQSISVNGKTYQECVPCPDRCYNGCTAVAAASSSLGTSIVCNQCRPGFLKNETTGNCDSLCGDGPFAVSTLAPTAATSDNSKVVCKKCTVGCISCNLDLAKDEPPCRVCDTGFKLFNDQCVLDNNTSKSSTCDKMSVWSSKTNRCECDASLGYINGDSATSCV